MGAAAAARWEGGRTQRQCAVGGRTRTVQLRERKAKRGRRLLIEAVVLTEAVVGFAVRRRMVESASTVVLAERILQQNSLAQHWARDWRALALTQVHHGSRLSDSCEDGEALSSVHSTALAAGKLIRNLLCDGRVKND